MNGRLLALLGVAAVVVAARHWFGELPEERDVTIRVTDPSVDRVALTWHEGEEVVHHTDLGAPFEARPSKIQLRDGAHRVTVSLHRGAEVTLRERRVDVDADAAQIVLDVP